MKLFVYGTLREGCKANDTFLKDFIIKKEQGYVKGSLHNLTNRSFPALIDGDQMIVGDVYTLSDDFDFTLMDEYELYYGEGNKNNLYNRVLIDVYDEQCNFKESASAYMYNLKREHSIDELGPIIKSNDFFFFF